MNTKRKGLLQKVFMIMLVLCLVCGNGLMALADEAVASSMRLTKTEGTVSVTNKNGRDMGTMADMKLFNGYHLSTEQKSYAWMNLDDHKLIKLDAVSEAEIQKKGKDLEVLLNSGNLLFNVSENLKADETLNIRTSTMVTGIRGTCGWVKVIDSSRTQVYILEGQVQCYVMDPVTGQYKSIMLRSGETAEFVVYDQTRVGDKCDILVNRFSEKDIPGFVAVELLNNSDLRDRITGATNLDMNWIFNNASGVLVQDQNTVEQKFAPVNDAVQKQEKTVVKNPLFGEDEDDGDNGGGGGNGTVTPPDEPEEPDNPTPPTEPTDLIEITLTVAEAEADNQLNFYLSMETMETVTIISDSPDILNISDITTISSDQQLILSDGVGLQVEEGAELRINGKLSTTNGDITNYGTIMNTNLYSFNVGSSLYNETGGIIENTGKISIGTILNNNGEITSSGLLIGSVTVMEGGRLDILSNDTELQNVGKGPLTVVADTDGYVALYSDMPDFVSVGMNGGTVEYAGANQERLDVNNGHVIVSGGSTIGELYVQGMESTVTVNTGGTVEELFTTSSIVTVDGGTVTELTEVRGEVSGDGTTTATTPSTVTVNNGNVGTITMDRGDLNVGGGTLTTVNVTNQIRVTDGFIATLNTLAPRAFVDGGEIQNANVTAGAVIMSGGNVSTYSVEGATLNVSGGTVGMIAGNSVQGLINIEGGIVNEVTSIATLNVSGGTVTKTEAFGNCNITGGQIIDLVVNNSATSSLTGGTAERVQVTDCALEINGTFEAGSVSSKDSNLYLEENYSGKIRTLEIDGNYVDETGDISVSYVAGGTVTDGMVVTGTDTILEIIGGTIKVGEAEAALTIDIKRVDTAETNAYNVNIGECTIDGQDKMAITLKDGVAIIREPDQEDNSAGAIIRANKIDNLISVPEVTMNQMLLCGEEAITETTIFNTVPAGEQLQVSSVHLNLYYAIVNAVAGETVTVREDNDNITSYKVVEVWGGSKDNPVVLDLNGNKLYSEAEITIVDGAALEICDSAEGGCFTVGYINVLENGICTVTKSTIEGVIVNYGTLSVDEGTFWGYDNCITNYADLSLTGNVLFGNIQDLEYEKSEMFAAISQYTGITTISNCSVKCDFLDECYSFLNASFMSRETGESEMNTFSKTYIDNSSINSGIAVAIHIVDGATLEVIDSTITSCNFEGTIEYEHYENEEEQTVLFLNSGVIENTGIDEYDSSYSAIYIKTPTLDYDPAKESPFIITLPKMIIKSETQYPIDYNSYEEMINDYLANFGYMIQLDNSGEWYSIVECPQSSAFTLSLRGAFNSGTEPEYEEIATASNSTPSNASGTPTPSKSAIPMAVAMLAGLMAIAPKLFEDSEYKNRKER